ncbi:MAG: phage tail assembly protein [Helicobacteraceae bacterium]|nr:phage tail assembly protein [Helicobacteraceae bacterium]
MREPLVRDLRAVKEFKDPQEKEVRLLSNLTNLTIDEIDAFTMKEYGKIQKVLHGFLS